MALTIGTEIRPDSDKIKVTFYRSGSAESMYHVWLDADDAKELAEQLSVSASVIEARN